ncbi:MAG: ArsR/SmtB family transcription factor [Candidatus Dormibacteria bacterium]
MPTNPGPPRRVLPLALSQAHQGELGAYFEGLANPTRLRVVERLAQIKEARVSDMAMLLGISQPRMSWHLRLMRRAGIVTTRRDGREVFCRLDRESIGANFRRFEQLLGTPFESGVRREPQRAEPTNHSAPATQAVERPFPEVVG